MVRDNNIPEVNINFYIYLNPKLIKLKFWIFFKRENSLLVSSLIIGP